MTVKLPPNSNRGRPDVVVPFLDLAAHGLLFREEAEAAIRDVIAQGDFILGSETARFEERFARFIGVDHAVGVGNGLDALRLSLLALEIGPGDEVIVPANTFIATALAASSIGARPVLVDCDSETYNIDVTQVESAITPNTCALIPVHLTGQAAEMDALIDISNCHGLSVVEDVAHAPGAEYRGRKCGSMGQTGCFSFYPGKNFGAFGDGGLVSTNDAKLAKKLRRMRNYGQRVKYEHTEKGLNSRLDTLQAATLNVKLPYLQRWNSARAKHAAQYRIQLEGVGDIAFQCRSPDSTHVYHLFVIETEQRDALKEHLDRCGVETLIHYPKPIHLQKAYQNLGHELGDFPQAEQLARRMLSLPIYPELRPEQVVYVADSIRRFFAS